MACGCETYTCLEVMVNPCNVGTSLGVEAAESGNYLIQVLFNSTWNNLSVSVNEGDEISVPTFVLNEQYTHEIRITPPTGDMVCYKAITSPSFNVAGYTPVPPADDTWQWGELSASGNSISNVLLGGEISPIIWLDQNPTDWEAVGITHTGDTLDFMAIGGFTGTLIFQYRNLP